MSSLTAKRTGFRALYAGVATLAYLSAATEAALTPHDFVNVGLEMRSARGLPMIVDGGCGWGDPMHLHRVVKMAIAAGLAVIADEMAKSETMANANSSVVRTNDYREDQMVVYRGVNLKCPVPDAESFQDPGFERP